MKKVGKIILASALLVPSLALFACSSPSSYTLTTYSSNELLGTVSGGSQKSLTEGTIVSISATPKPNSDAQFLCWIRNRSQIVSTESSVDITLGADTDGTYTALWNEASPSSMLYATATSLTYSAENIASIDYTISYAYSTSTTNFNTLVSGTMEGNSSNAIFEDDVFYLGSTGAFYNYIFRVNVVATYSDTGNIATETLEFSSDMISNSSFTNGTATLTGTTQQGIELSLVLEKINANMFSEQ